MGVPKFYRWTSERYPCLSEVINENQIPEFDNLYLDMNGIIHNCSHPNDDDITFRITEEEIFVNIFAYIENLYNLIRPQKVFFMAVDGVAPRAKMNQQRARRFMSAKTSEIQQRKAVEKGVEMPDEKRFDSNCITPGTHFMHRLHTRLGEWVEKKIHNDSNWRNRRIYLSGHDCPGEGEHKIMDFIRSERSQNGYDPNTRHCMYGLDADLIMLGIVSHEPHFSLLREEVTFNRPRKGDKKKPQRNDSDGKKFHLLHLSLLREYLAWEFSSIRDQTPFEYDMERIVDDWILMGLLVGNDFLPHLPHVHIHDDALPLLYKTYKNVLPTLDGYINEGGYLNLPRFEKFLKELSKNDKSSFMDKMEDMDWMDAKRAGNEGDDELVEFVGDEGLEDSEALEGGEEKRSEERYEVKEDAAFVDSEDDEPVDGGDDEEQSSGQFDRDLTLEDDFNEALALADFMAMDEKEFENNVEACWTKSVNNSFKKFKNNYYNEKMKYRNISKSELKEQAEGYVRAIQWNLHYYYHGCVSWSWFYPHHYAPYISDVVDFCDMKIEFEMSSPFKPFEQLLAVLPTASSECLPRPLQELMTNDAAVSPIHDFYPNEFSTDLNGKKNDWEAVILIPFIEEQRLLEAMESKLNQLTPEEKLRNQHGPHLLYTTEYVKEKLCVKKTLINKDTFRLPKEKVKWGLLPNVKMDVYFPGFPTMKHLPHRGELKQANVNVFGQATRRESMILSVEKEQEKDIIEWASELLEEEVCIDWPILKLAKVESIWGDGRIVRKSDSDEIIAKDMDDEQLRQWVSVSNSVSERVLTRYGIEVEEDSEKTKERKKKGALPKRIIVWARRFIGLTYRMEKDENGAPVLRPVKQFSAKDQVVPVLLPLVVRDVLLEESRRLGDLPITNAFPLQSVAWVTDPKSKLFGIPSMVSAIQNENSENCTVLLIGMVAEKNIEKMEQLRENWIKKSVKWSGGYDGARSCGINVGSFSRITGTMFLWNEERKLVETGRQISSDNKINIGLNLKFSKRNKCVADYTERVDNDGSRGGPQKTWLYSNLTCRVAAEYKKKFPEVFRLLDQISDNDDVYYAEDIWRKPEVRAKKFEELKEFLENLPSKEAEVLDCGTEYADRLMIAEIEKVQEEKQSAPHMVKLSISPSSLFRPELYDGKTMVDPDADFQPLDRVACMASNLPIQRTIQGTVVGVHGNKIDVLFDREFAGGSIVRGSKKPSSIRLSKALLFNLTYGLVRKNAKNVPESNRKNRRKNKKEERKPADEMDGAYVPWKPKNTASNDNNTPSTSKILLDVKTKKSDDSVSGGAELMKMLKISGNENEKSRGKKLRLDELLGAPSSSAPPAQAPKVESENKNGKKITLAELLGAPPASASSSSSTEASLKKGQSDRMKMLMEKMEKSVNNSTGSTQSSSSFSNSSVSGILRKVDEEQIHRAAQHSQDNQPNVPNQPNVGYPGHPAQPYNAPTHGVPLGYGHPMTAGPVPFGVPIPPLMAQALAASIQQQQKQQQQMNQERVRQMHQQGLRGDNYHYQSQNRQQNQQQQQQQSVTDFKPSTVTRGGSRGGHRGGYRGGARGGGARGKPQNSQQQQQPCKILKPPNNADVNQPQKSTSKSDSKSSGSGGSASKKKRQSRLGVNFDGH